MDQQCVCNEFQTARQDFSGLLRGGKIQYSSSFSEDRKTDLNEH